MDEANDRISQLPESILHHILSFLKPEETSRTACLSKSWLSVWLTYPNLTFKIYPDNTEQYEKLKRYAKNTLSRFSMSELSVHSVSLALHSASLEVESAYPPDCLLMMKSIIRFAVEKHVKILHVDCSEMPMSCRFPEIIFCANSLIELKLRNCSFNYNWFPDTKLEFDNLKKVVLDFVYLYDQRVFDTLFSNSMLIEEIVLYECHLYSDKLRVSNFPKLKRFMMQHCFCEMVEIDSPSLESFDYLGAGRVDFYACRSLKRLALGAEHKTLENTCFSKFMYLEDLDLWIYAGAWPLEKERLNISSKSLKRVRLEEPYNTTWEVMIDAPNLFQLNYDGYRFNSLSFRNLPNELKISLNMPSEVNESPSTWFRNFRKFLMEHLNKTKVYLSLDIEYDTMTCFEIQEDLQELPKPEVEHLVLNILSEKINQQALVDGLFWSCHPKYISVRWLIGVEPDCELIEYLWENVMIRGGSILNCCRNQQLDKAEIGRFSGICDASKTLGEVVKDAAERGKTVCFQLK